MRPLVAAESRMETIVGDEGVVEGGEEKEEEEDEEAILYRS